MANTKVGVIGCGKISAIYLKNSQRLFDGLEVAACADLLLDRAKAAAAEYGVAKACSVEEMLADDEIEIVLNLTIPNAHASVAMAAVKAGKHVYNEKPLTITRKEGEALLAAAEKAGLRVGSAPDTFLGAAFQTCRKLIDDGAIGRPIGATAFMMGHGHESWHPDPEFYYKVGGGPMFDMGPYYLTALVSMLGPMRRVTGSAQMSFAERTITSEPKKGQVIKVDVPTHVAGVVDFAGGAVCTLIMSFDVWAKNLPQMEIYGTEGSLSIPSPNGFNGPVRIHRGAGGEWQDVEHTHGYVGSCRAAGLNDMAEGIRDDRAHRCSGELAYHVLDAMHAFHDASDTGRHIELKSTCAQPQAMPLELRKGLGA